MATNVLYCEKLCKMKKGKRGVEKGNTMFRAHMHVLASRQLRVNEIVNIIIYSASGNIHTLYLDKNRYISWS